MKKKIIYLCPDIPTELQSGRQLRDFALLKLLIDKYDVEIFCLKRPIDAAQFKLEIPINIFERKMKPKYFRWIEKKISPVLIKFSLHIISFFSQTSSEAELQKVLLSKLTNSYSKNHNTILWISHPRMLPSLSHKIKKLHHKKRNFRVFVDLPYTESNRHRFFKLTKKYFRWIDHLFVPSELSRARMEKFLRQTGHFKKSVSILRPFIQISPEKTFKNGSLKKETSRSGIHSNTDTTLWIALDLDLENHLESFWWFYEEIFPRIRGTERGQRLKVYAPLPRRRGITHHFSNIEWLDRINEKEFLSTKPICVIPLIKSPGAPIACLRALSQGLPLIASSKATEALIIQPSEHFLLEETEDGFASAICQTLTNVELQAKLSLSGFNAAKKYHNWTELPESLVSVLESAQ